MWQVKLLTILSKFAGPLIAAVVALVLSLSVALWWTNNRLDEARHTLADVRADVRTCTRANASQRQVISELTDAAERNRTQLEGAIRRQRAAVNRITELEARKDEQHGTEIERVIRVADGDLCAGAAIPDRLRGAAGYQ